MKQDVTFQHDDIHLYKFLYHFEPRCLRVPQAITAPSTPVVVFGSTLPS